MLKVPSMGWWGHTTKSQNDPPKEKKLSTWQKTLKEVSTSCENREIKLGVIVKRDRLSLSALSIQNMANVTTNSEI